MDLSKQYNNFADDFSRLSGDLDTVDPALNNSTSINAFYGMIDFLEQGTKLLDVACGDGTDLVHYKSLGADIYGVDSSEEMIALAKAKNPEAVLEMATFDALPFPDNFFDAVVSKYAIQTAPNIEPAFSEIHRVLKPGGVLMYLAVHPFRQYLERKEIDGDYFSQTVVDSIIFGGAVHLKEPTHTMNEYFNKDFLSKFDVVDYKEVWDPAAEQINNAKYPGFFILKARKR